MAKRGFANLFKGKSFLIDSVWKQMKKKMKMKNNSKNSLTYSVQ